MNNSDFKRRLQAVVVGNSSDDFIDYAAGLLGGYNVDFVVCRDVYSAAARLAGNKGGDIVVIGRLGRLIKEQGRLLEKISEKDLACCCLAEGNSERDRRQIEQATARDAFVINKAAQLEEVMTKLLERGLVFSSEKKKNFNAAGFNRDEFACTKAELDALLGV